ncbi:MAG TPA: response regulator transcription factor [Vicinamibacterales bacterium]|nr:response regulator transcription factor [Vicinamibacterales bacterium]
MRILIAEDDAVTARILESLTRSWGYETSTIADGHAALAALEAAAAPQLALLDWVMPGIDGPEICRRVRAAGRTTYLILLTAKTQRADVVAGLDAGADDYLVKPFDPEELRARVKAGTRIIDLQQRLAAHVAELEDALANVRRLSGLLPICSYCKAIRDDSDYWHRVEEYVTEHADVKFSHGICPKCLDHVYKEWNLAKS